MKPPPPTTHDPLNLKKEETQVAHRAAMIPMVLGLLAIGAFAVYTVWDDVQPRRVRKVTTGQMQMLGTMSMNGEMEDAGGRTEDMMTAMMPTAQPSNLMLVRSSDQVLLSEPANLPQPNGGTRISGFARVDGHVAEQYAIWEFTGQTAEQVQQTYADAAISMGFSKLNAKSASQTQATNTVYVRSPQIPDETHLTPPGEQVLVVRTRELADKKIKLLLWYRYPISQNMP
ncbi:MAG: hypothetical protein ACF8OB_09365 [Phycisphaeraceae bacterium JB051]